MFQVSSVERNLVRDAIYYHIVVTAAGRPDFANLDVAGDDLRSTAVDFADECGRKRRLAANEKADFSRGRFHAGGFYRRRKGLGNSQVDSGGGFLVARSRPERPV